MKQKLKPKIIATAQQAVAEKFEEPDYGDQEESKQPLTLGDIEADYG